MMFKGIPVVLIFILLQMIQIPAVIAQEFEFVYSRDTGRSDRNYFRKVFYDEGELITHTRSLYYNTLAVRQDELMRFDLSGNVIKRLVLPEDCEYCANFRSPLQEYNDSLLLSRHYYIDSLDVTASEINLINKEIDEIGRTVYFDTVNQVKDFTVNDIDELTVVGKEIDGQDISAIKIHIPSGDTSWSNNRLFSSLPTIKLPFFCMEKNGKTLVTGTIALPGIPIMSVIDEQGNDTPLFMASEIAYTLAAPLFFEDNPEGYDYGIVYMGSLSTKYPSWVNDFSVSVEYGYVRIAGASHIEEEPSIIVERANEREVANLSIYDFDYLNGYYYYCGTYGEAFIDERGFLLKVSETGEVEYFRSYQYKDHPFNEILAIHVVDEDLIVLAGETWEKREDLPHGNPSSYKFAKLYNAAWVFNVCPGTGDKKVDNPDCSPLGGVDHIAEDAGVRIFPNPISSGEVLHIQSREGLRSIRIYTASGSLVFSRSVSGNVFDIRGDELKNATGILVCEVVTQNEKRYVEKLVVH